MPLRPWLYLLLCQQCFIILLLQCLSHYGSCLNPTVHLYIMSAKTRQHLLSFRAGQLNANADSVLLLGTYSFGAQVHQLKTNAESVTIRYLIIRRSSTSAQSKCRLCVIIGAHTHSALNPPLKTVHSSPAFWTQFLAFSTMFLSALPGLVLNSKWK